MNGTSCGLVGRHRRANKTIENQIQFAKVKVQMYLVKRNFSFKYGAKKSQYEV